MSDSRSVGDKVNTPAILNTPSGSPSASPSGSASFAPKPPSLVRFAWGLLFLVCTVLFLSLIPARFQALRLVSDSAPSITHYQITASEAQLLAEYRISMDAYAIYNLAFETIQIGTFVAVAVWLFVRGPDTLPVIFFSAALLLAGIVSPATVRTGSSESAAQQVVALLDLLRLNFVMAFIYTFPNGRFVPPWTRWTALIWSVAITVLIVVAGGIPNWPPLFQGLATVLWLGPALASQYHRYRHKSTQEQRLQTRWFVFGLTLVLIAAFLRGLLAFTFSALTEPGGIRLIFYVLVAVPIFDTLLFITLPLSIGVAIARYRLYGLSLMVNRWLVYGGVIGLLLFVFFLVFFVLQGFVQLIGGEPSLALVIATAICVALFNPARSHLQQFVDRRFFNLRLNLDRLADDQRTRLMNVRDDSKSDLNDKTLGIYKLGALVGKGGMSEVYHAVHRTLGQPVAIKILSEQLVHVRNFRVRFEQEAKIVAALRHPNIVRVFDLGAGNNETGQGVYYMAMEYVDGEDLGDILRQRKHLLLDEVQKIITEVASALDYAHTHGLIHRDVKPSNVMLRSENGSAVLMDFGIAKLMEEQTNLTGSILMGTLDYASPEQIMSQQTIDGRADVYALGVMTYQMLTGSLPFAGGVGQVVFAHLQQPAPDPRTLRPEISEAVAKAIMRAMAKTPSDRFPTAVAFARAIEAS